MTTPPMSDQDFANRDAEEFRLAMAYQKFEERAVQMRQVASAT